MPDADGPGLAHLFRHPIKGIGVEALQLAELTIAGALKGDRAWALRHAGAEPGEGWLPRRNFLQVASGPALARVSAESHAEGVRLSHPELESITIAGIGDGPALARWVAPLWPEARNPPTELVPAPGHGMTDSPDPFVSIGNLASLRALSQRAGQALDMRRFRINLWVEGWAPWEEFDMLGRAFRIGDVVVEGRERIERCRAPEADPETGQRNVNICRVLEDGWGHIDFGILAQVSVDGSVRLGDRVSVV